MAPRLFLKLILAVVGVLIVSLIAVDFMASRIAETTYTETLTRELEEKCRMLALGDPTRLTQERAHRLAAAAAGRLTVITRDGRVVVDSGNNPEAMENHARRPEVAAALAGKTGSSRRTSPTMGLPFLYVAIPIPEGALRLAVPLGEVTNQVDEIRQRMLYATSLAFLPAVFIAAIFARYTATKLASIIDYAGQLAQGNFRARLKTSGSDELGVLSGKLKETGEKLEEMFDQLQTEHAELEKLERVRKDFVINVSHELRTPLASIQGYTETLLDGALFDPNNNVRFLSIIRQNAERLARLTADLLTLSRVELRQTRFQFASYYVNGLLRNSIDALKPLADRKNIHLHLDPAPDSLDVFCDAEAVHQILSNLIDNAIKYTPENGTVFLNAQHLGGDPELVEICVRDTGFGIPQDEMLRLFERFYRVDKARSRELGGTGLGLAIVKHLTLAQGGTVRVASETNCGATFCFTLPVHDLGLQETGAVQSELTIS